MSLFLTRYRAGEQETVYAELVALGKKINDSSVLSDATQVAREIIDRCVFNLRLLFGRLSELNYKFKNPQNAFVEASTNDRLRLQAAESDFGAFPLILREWYDRISSLDFSQEDNQLLGKSAIESVDVCGLGLNAPLIVLSIPNCIELRNDLIKDGVIEDDPASFNRFWPIGGSCSNSDPTGFDLPNSVFDAMIDGEADGGILFIEGIRGAFRAGGFPYWQHLLRNKKMAHPVRKVPNYQDLLPQLTEGLLPI